jgi:hypothetical protein
VKSAQSSSIQIQAFLLVSKTPAPTPNTSVQMEDAQIVGIISTSTHLNASKTLAHHKVSSSLMGNAKINAKKASYIIQPQRVAP